MDLSYVKKLIKLVSESDVHEIEIEEEGKKVRVTKAQPPASRMEAYAAPYAAAPPPPGHAGSPAAQAPPPPAPAASASKVHEIKSPIVGTFYKAPAPDAAPFVQVGAHVESGTVLCIVEAMKLMNEIESDIAGTVIKVMAENGQPVEYGQTLFLVEPS